MFSIYKEVWKIIKHSIRFWQMLAFSISAFIGLTIILFALFCYVDFKEISFHDSAIFKDEFIVISKKVSTIHTITQKTSQFTSKEMKDIAAQEFFTEVASFQSSRFHIQLYTQNKHMPLQTDLFFESVPDMYINQDSQTWTWKESDTFIPIIVPRNFLALYNFGFAPSQGLPQLSEDVISKITFNVRISGNNMRKEFTARIVNFSDKINTVLVPETFLQWANQTYGYEDEGNPSRVILGTKNSADSRIFEYIAQNKYQINDDTIQNSKLSFYLKVTTTIVATIGFVIAVLAMYLLLFSFYLIIEKKREKIQIIWHLGYSFSAIMLPYNVISIVANGIICIAAFVAAYIANNYVIHFVQQFLPVSQVPITVPLIACISLYCIIILVNFISIKRVLYSAIS
ncbi:MAG: hypothetical protein M0R02_01465 [Bacteroidales bacterium]|jgi:hypothetical protein|nr:hypothetical protein [Bacteroidales bacterium]NLK81702.1 hypothetical protein [Bacteroidales bacterium]